MIYTFSLINKYYFPKGKPKTISGIAFLPVSECMCPLCNPVCGSLSDQIPKICFSPVIILLKPSGAPVALEKKSKLLECKGLLNLAPASVCPRISTSPSTILPSGRASIPLVLEPGELCPVPRIMLFSTWRAPHSLSLSLYLSKRCLSKLSSSTSFSCSHLSLFICIKDGK